MIKRFFQWFFATPAEQRSWLKVIWWWESRRIPYNVFVLPIGFISVILYAVFLDLSHSLEPGEDAIEPMLVFIAPFIANIFYTCGWIAELFLRIVWKVESPMLAPTFLKLGLSFSFFVELFPVSLALLAWIITMIR